MLIVYNDLLVCCLIIFIILKMLGLYLVGQNCLHLTSEQYLSSETYSSKYEKLPNIVILAYKNITEKMHLLETSGPQIWLCLFTFRPIASKQLNGLTTIENVSWLGGLVVTHPLWVQAVLGSIPGSGKGFYVSFFCFVVVVFLLFCQKHITGKCLKPEQFLKAEHLLKHAFPYRNRSFYGPDR